MLKQWNQIGGLTALSLLLGLGGCVSTPTPLSVSPSASATTNATTTSSPVTKGDRPLVVATNTVICDLTQQIAADTVNLKCLIDRGVDAHEYKPKPDDSKAIEQAKLIFYGGYNFEPELIRLIKASSNTAPKIAIDEVAVPKPQEFEEDGKTEADPHVFHNAANGAQLAAVISKNLTQLEPKQAALYAANSKKLIDELTQINTWIKAEIATIPSAQRKLVTTHDAFGYYARAYGIPVIGALQGVSTDEKATPTRVKELVKAIQTAQVPTIFAEVSINPKLIESVAKEARVRVADRTLFTDGLGEKGSEGDTYQKMLLANTEVIVEGLGGKYTPFQAK
ncbi:MAG: zinc ABC transporter substrate-binding protein [Tildeniella nuda ZEHNDER 1965/U140]|jgi:manganese/iron transport system substrate-binding protein|nr:zinc ABC transporter substrate-binding protein [Tildeniella nuda ZEHNDER 1965/U140]